MGHAMPFSYTNQFAKGIASIKVEQLRVDCFSLFEV